MFFVRLSYFVRKAFQISKPIPRQRSCDRQHRVFRFISAPISCSDYLTGLLAGVGQKRPGSPVYLSDYLNERTRSMR